MRPARTIFWRIKKLLVARFWRESTSLFPNEATVTDGLYSVKIRSVRALHIVYRMVEAEILFCGGQIALRKDPEIARNTCVRR
jgi:hypothetical protein